MNSKPTPSTEQGMAQARETYDKMSAASAETADALKKSASTSVKGAQEFNNKFMEFAHANTNAAFDFFQKMLEMKSPSEFVELSSEHARKHLEMLTSQTKELAALAQKAALDTAEPIKAGMEKQQPASRGR